MSTQRHVPFAEMGFHASGSFGHPDQTKSLNDLLNAPPLAKSAGVAEILSILVYQQSATVQLLLELTDISVGVAALRGELAGVRRDLKSAQTRVAVAREKAAKAEEKAAKAREKAAAAEERAKTAQPPLLIQVGSDIERFEPRIRRKF